MLSFYEERIHHLEQENAELRKKLAANYNRTGQQAEVITRMVEDRNFTSNLKLFDPSEN